MNFMSGLGDSLNSGVESAKTRVATAQAGKKMLDEGGPTKEAEIYALNAMRAARSEDDKLTKQLNDEVKSYEEAVKSIKKALATPTKRLANVKEAARALAAVKPPLPKTTPEEDDACAILWVKLIGKKTDKPPILSS
ncbi:hypothetical protein JL720_3701 [Aureococcus anophagefferens]|nr:hypothetical protein JL720_3701 [Aureococcus anophagefferens]